jgi:hypothetical protein
MRARLAFEGSTTAGLVFVVPLLFAATASPADPQAVVAGPIVFSSQSNDVSAPLREFGSPTATPASAVGTTGGGILLGPVESFEGIANRENPADEDGGIPEEPPDTNGAVGPSDYVQWVNSSIAVYDKHGTRLLGPLPGNMIWNDFGGLCETENRGDPTVRYDQLADRWVLTQFAWKATFDNPTPPFLQCFAVSKTPDPTGPYYRYAFTIPDDVFNDYVKLAVWPDAYYLTEHRYQMGPVGAGAFAFDRNAMLAGLPATAVYFQLGPGLFGILPSDLDGPTPPPPHTPDTFVKADDDGCNYPHDQLELWRFAVNFARPEASTFVGPTPLRTEPFDSTVCTGQVHVSQPGTAQQLDLLSDRMMYRASYRNFGAYQSLVALHADVIDGRRIGMRWYEIRDPARAARIAQQGTYAPDPDSRWMGSVAQDGLGDLAIGFSLAGADTFPSIGYAGRASTDPPGTMSSGEGRLATGSASQTASLRWGDYSSLTVDPVDDCTFWYTQEYYPAGTEPDTVDWHTRIGSFRFPDCGPVSTLGGTSREGEVLTAGSGSWPELPAATFGYQWRRCDANGETCIDIPGATGRTYRLGTLDVDNTIRVDVRAANGAATASALSRPSGLVAPVPAAGPLPLVTTLEATPPVVELGRNVTYTATVSDAGSTGSATGVVLTFAVPPGVTVLTAQADRGPGCTGSQSVVCPLDFVPGGRTATVTIVARPTARGTLTAATSAVADQPAADPASSRSVATITVRGTPQVAVVTPARVRSTGNTTVVTASLSIDEPASLTLRAFGPRGKALTLLPGSSIGHTGLHKRKSAVTAAVAKGPITVVVRLRARPRRGRLTVQATDRDGMSSTHSLPFGT